MIHITKWRTSLFSTMLFIFFAITTHTVHAADVDSSSGLAVNTENVRIDSISETIRLDEAQRQYEDKVSSWFRFSIFWTSSSSWPAWYQNFVVTMKFSIENRIDEGIIVLSSAEISDTNQVNDKGERKYSCRVSNPRYVPKLIN